MGKIYDKVELCGKICKEVIAFFDRGSTHSFIDPELVRELQLEATGRRKDVAIPPARAEKANEYIGDVIIKGQKSPKARLYEMKIGEQLLIGLDLMQDLGIKLDPSKKTIVVNPNSKPIISLGWRLEVKE
jgi:hypothetical protein